MEATCSDTQEGAKTKVGPSSMKKAKTELDEDWMNETYTSIRDLKILTNGLFKLSCSNAHFHKAGPKDRKMGRMPTPPGVINGDL